MSKKISQILKNKNLWVSFRKISLVIFITLLIWIWADLSQDDVYTDSTSVLTIGPSEPDLWVRFKDDNNSQLDIEKVEFEGPTLRIAELKQDIESGLFKMRFTLDPAKFISSESAESVTISLLAELAKNTDIRKRGLKVVKCSPENVTILANKLVEKELKLRCMKGSAIINDAQFEPDIIKMLVPPTLTDDQLVADVKITSEAQATKAKSQFIEVRPEIKFAAGIAPRLADLTVKVKLPKESELGLVEKVLTGSIGIVGSKNILDKYTVVVENESDFTTIRLKATEKAFQAYESKPYKILIEILAEDEKTQGLITRKPVYNFPQEFVKLGEIEKVHELDDAKFKLIPKNGTITPAGQ